jgi:hypothetical protein
MLQLIVLVLLFFVMVFGIGFILNMLIKTTWFPVWLFLIAGVPLGLYFTWDETKSFADNLTAYSYVDISVALAGLAGAYTSGWAIRKLRRSGYKMF